MQNTLGPRHIIELVAVQVIYWVCVGVAAFASTAVAAGGLRTFLTLLPILPGVAIIFVTIRIVRRCDEYIRIKLLEAGCITAALTAAWTLIYSYLEIIGLPRISMVWVGNIGWSAFIVFNVRLMLSGRNAK